MSSFQAVWQAVQGGELPDPRSLSGGDEVAAHRLLAAVREAQRRGMRRDQLLALAADIAGRATPAAAAPAGGRE